MTLNPALNSIYQTYIKAQGESAANAWLREYLEKNQTVKTQQAKVISTLPMPKESPQEAQVNHEDNVPHASYSAALNLLEPYKQALGAAYETLFLIARWHFENTNESTPAPHMLTTYWSLSELLGKSERTIQRHIHESGHPWSDTVAKFIDTKASYGYWHYRNENEKTRKLSKISGIVIRFFPKTRLSPQAEVKRFGWRDLLVESDLGRTKPVREVKRALYERQESPMSLYEAITKKAKKMNVVMQNLDALHADATEDKSFVNLYNDIPDNSLLDRFFSDYTTQVNSAVARGASVARAMSRWVEQTSLILAQRFGDNGQYQGLKHLEAEFSKNYDPKSMATFYEISLQGNVKASYRMIREGYVLLQKDRVGKYKRLYLLNYTNLWRRALWTCIRANESSYAIALLKRTIALILDAQRDPNIRNPSAYAWHVMRDEWQSLRNTVMYEKK